MKKKYLILVFTFISFVINAQSIIGAYEYYSTSENGDQLKNVVIFADGYQVIATYNADSGKFISTNGGSWKLEGELMTEKIEFDTKEPERVGSEKSFKVLISRDKSLLL